MHWFAARGAWGDRRQITRQPLAVSALTGGAGWVRHWSGPLPIRSLSRDQRLTHGGE
jgi:hypothetical protein